MKTLGPFNGVDNTTAEATAPASSLLASDNIFLDDDNSIKTRPGYTTRYPAVAPRDLKVTELGAVFVAGGKFILDGVPIGDAGNAPAKYAELGGRLFATTERALVELSSTGVAEVGAEPPAAPVVSGYGAGTLPPARYGVALAHRFPQVSGQGATSWVEAEYGLQIEVPEGDYDAYVTAADGAEFYYCASAQGPCSITVTEPPTGPISRVRYLSKPPAGDGVWAWAGFLLVRYAGVLYRSEPQSPALFDLRSFISMGDPIVAVAPLPAALVLQTTAGVYFVDSPDLSAASIKRVAAGSAVKEALAPCDAFVVSGGKRSGKCAVGLVDGVPFVVYDDGSYELLTLKYVSACAAEGQVALVKLQGDYEICISLT